MNREPKVKFAKEKKDSNIQKVIFGYVQTPNNRIFWNPIRARYVAFSRDYQSYYRIPLRKSRDSRFCARFSHGYVRLGSECHSTEALRERTQSHIRIWTRESTMICCDFRMTGGVCIRSISDIQRRDEFSRTQVTRSCISRNHHDDCRHARNWSYYVEFLAH